MEAISTFINETGKMFKKDNIQLTNRVYIILGLLLLCMLPFAGGVVGIGGMVLISLYCIATLVYNRKIKESAASFKKIFISYLLLFGYLFVAFNLALYSLPRLMGLNWDMFVILTIVLEMVCMASGYFYAYLLVKTNRIEKHKKADAVAISLVATFSSGWAIFLRRFVSTASIETQAFVLLGSLAVCCCTLSFYIGKLCLPMWYYIKKYRIDEFFFWDE